MTEEERKLLIISISYLVAIILGFLHRGLNHHTLPLTYRSLVPLMLCNDTEKNRQRNGMGKEEAMF